MCAASESRTPESPAPWAPSCIMTDPRPNSGGGASPLPAESVSTTLLERLQAQDPEAWRWVVRLCYPLVRGWCQRAGLQSADATDVAQEVFRALTVNVCRFRREGGKNSFRGWLWGITCKQLLGH